MKKLIFLKKGKKRKRFPGSVQKAAKYSIISSKSSLINSDLIRLEKIFFLAPVSPEVVLQ